MNIVLYTFNRNRMTNRIRKHRMNKIEITVRVKYKHPLMAMTLHLLLQQSKVGSERVAMEWTEQILKRTPLTRLIRENKELSSNIGIKEYM